MGRIAFALALLCAGTAAQAGSTDFGIRTFDGGRVYSQSDLAKAVTTANAANAATTANAVNVTPAVVRRSGSATGVDLAAIARLGGQWGRVTSTWRSVAHNRDVGGVPNSYHLSGQAIDIARRSGVSHWQIVTAYRNAGYSMIEALDEGDHTHLAFGTPHRSAPRPQMVVTQEGGQTQWRIVYAPSR